MPRKQSVLFKFAKYAVFALFVYIIYNAIQSETKEGFNDHLPTGGSSLGASFIEPTQKDHDCDAETALPKQGKCSGGCNSNGDGDLLPVLDPLFNMREICKQSILLEDHLANERKSCVDCIRKHCLTIEALAEESITLDKEGKCKDLYSLPDTVRELISEIKDGGYKGDNLRQVGQKFRAIRKSLMPRCFDSF